MSESMQLLELEVNRKRANLPKRKQVEIFQRDAWLCYWCRKPVIFAPVMKLLETMTEAESSRPLAYYHAHWTRRDSPLLDELGAVIDHVNPFVAGGTCNEQNLVTACCKCNGRKSSAPLKDWEKREKRKAIKGKYGDPVYWDGLSKLFVVLAEANHDSLTSSEKDWLKALKQ